jgi:GcrA cell cycle regulator
MTSVRPQPQHLAERDLRHDFLAQRLHRVDSGEQRLPIPNHMHEGRMTSTLWSDENVAKLREMWAAKITYRDIGNAFGVTKNVIVGKIHRLGLANKIPPRKPKLEHMSREDKALRQRRAHGDRRLTQKLRYSSQPRVKEVKQPRAVEPAGDFLNIALLDLEFGQCRYPRGEQSPYFYCGQSVKEDSSYCPAHHALCCAPHRTDAQRAASSSNFTILKAKIRRAA